VHLTTEYGDEEHFVATKDGPFRVDHLPAGIAELEVSDARTGDVLGSLSVMIEQARVVHQDIDLTE